MGATPVLISNGKRTMNGWIFLTMTGKTTPTHQQDMVLQETTFSPIQDRVLSAGILFKDLGLVLT
eukprot:1164779-Ditylum_brightwellii.AAC.1